MPYHPCVYTVLDFGHCYSYILQLFNEIHFYCCMLSSPVLPSSPVLYILTLYPYFLALSSLHPSTFKWKCFYTLVIFFVFANHVTKITIQSFLLCIYYLMYPCFLYFKMQKKLETVYYLWILTYFCRYSV